MWTNVAQVRFKVNKRPSFTYGYLIMGGQANGHLTRPHEITVFFISSEDCCRNPTMI